MRGAAGGRRGGGETAENAPRILKLRRKNAKKSPVITATLTALDWEARAVRARAKKIQADPAASAKLARWQGRPIEGPKLSDKVED